MAQSGKFKCPKCDRTFSMAPHLGRHMSTIHGVKKARKAAKKRPGRGPQPRRGWNARTALRPAAPRGTGVAGAIGQLLACQGELVAQRAWIDAHIAAVEGALAALDGAARPVLRRRARRARGAASPVMRRRPRRPPVAGPQKGSLRGYMTRVLAAHRGPMIVRDIAAAVLKAGYKSRDKTLGHTVGKLLAAMPNAVRVARGQYRLRS